MVSVPQSPAWAEPRQADSEGWTRAKAEALYGLPFSDLLFRAHTLHRRHFNPNGIQLSRLLSIKTGGCPEDCGYCSQSARYDTGVTATRLMDLDDVVAAAGRAKAEGATRFCMGAAWRNPKPRDLSRVAAMIAAVKALGLETCATLGMLTEPQAEELRAAGLDYYNHNVDTSPAYYGEIITTRTLQDRLETLAHARRAGLKLCCGGIVGLGETLADRLDMLVLLANLAAPPESVPLNLWNEVPGVPVAAQAERPDAIAFARLIAVARIMMPTSVLRLSAGRQYMSDEAQALCFFAGANSLFLGETLLTTRNAGEERDAALFTRLGLTALSPSEGANVGA
ncbi:biotin synthase BioB [Microvirga sp. VF16]|uniref:biotin synthase BioB n=1 Tax=Microvirga sp. VF16 TaxID=2807101 RepID=UPI00193EC019|nr:biotin synthase BioB [Microvirga sp. VF16]QRM32337.1 biotin synthase BioB [Microvirga sp. VF16]